MLKCDSKKYIVLDNQQLRPEEGKVHRLFRNGSRIKWFEAGSIYLIDKDIVEAHMKIWEIQHIRNNKTRQRVAPFSQAPDARIMVFYFC